MTRKQKKESTARRVAEATLDVAVGGAALAADKAVETWDRVSERAEEVLRSGRRRARKARQQTAGAAEKARHRAESAAHEAREAVQSHDSRPYEERTRDELYDLASERDIEGRSNMTKEELIFALRAER